jgi:hypothetical protein
MMFRRLYWVTEQADAAQSWRVTGVYTSVHDLIDSGIRWVGDTGSSFRISLVKLDCTGDVLASWESPGFEGLPSGLRPYIETGEFTDDEAQSLCSALDSFFGVRTR